MFFFFIVQGFDTMFDAFRTCELYFIHKIKIFCCCKLKHANSTNVSVCIAVGRLVSAFDF